MTYNFKAVEKKWQERWEKEGLYRAEEDKKFPKSRRKYILDMFPYPSAQGLHVGHPEGYTASDILVRYYKMRGYNVLHPMGWDAFGLPAENYALKTGRHPRITTEENIRRMKEQIKALGFAYDWSREINTTDPEYYKWTQWIFLEMWKRGLAYEDIIPINWCPSCQTGLANEEVMEGKCERCGALTEKKPMKQWLLRITQYADRLLADLGKLDWPKKIKEMQENWIGKSEGVEINFKGIRQMEKKETARKKEKIDLEYKEYDIPVFTTRVDTVYGASAVILAPEHPLVLELVLPEHEKDVKKYIEESQKKREWERVSEEREKTGISLDAFALNPFNGEKVPIWIADYVLAGYGTGAVMLVPAHDRRDFAFAKKYGLEIREVVAPQELGKGIRTLRQAYVEDGILVNSGEFSGFTSRDGRVKMADFAESKNFGRRGINYHLRDWVFSRQRYWGEPIPLIHCKKCGVAAVPEDELPLKLPEIQHYEPTGTGESPLASIKKWVNTRCPQCGSPARRETNTMPQWAGSCWYYLAYLVKKNLKFATLRAVTRGVKIFHPATLPPCHPAGGDPQGHGWGDPQGQNLELIDYWMPVDIYIGGAEHAVLHLLYARFWYKFLYDLGLVPNDEPFIKLKNQGLILGEDGVKMSKSRGNVINPDEVIEKYGADTLRMYEMFMGPFEDAKPWSTRGIIGVKRFLDRIWTLIQENKKARKQESEENKKARKQENHQGLERLLHKTIKGVTEDIENFKFNTAISKLMILVNELSKQKELVISHWSLVIGLLAPFAPHLAEELWQKRGNKKSIFLSPWPQYDPELIKDEEFEMVVQVNGKVRDRILVSAEISEDEAKRLARESEKIKLWLAGKEIKKIIFTGKIINIVI